MSQQPRPRFTAKQFATREDLQALHEELHQMGEAIEEALQTLNRTQAIFEVALLKGLEDIESMSDSLVDAGIITDEEAEGEEETGVEERPGVGYPEFFEAEEESEYPIDHDLARDTEERYGEGKALKVVVDPDNPANEAEVEVFEGEGGAVEESPEDHEARVQAIRDRRKAAAQRYVEEANESDPIEAETDPNSIGAADVPPEGIVIIPGLDEPAGMERE